MAFRGRPFSQQFENKQLGFLSPIENKMAFTSKPCGVTRMQGGTVERYPAAGNMNINKAICGDRPLDPFTGIHQPGEQFHVRMNFLRSHQHRPVMRSDATRRVFPSHQNTFPHSQVEFP